MSEKPVVIESTFEDLKLSKPLLKAVAKLGWTHPSEIQARLIPPALEGRDVLGRARTGTGKTASFALPVLQRMTDAQSVRCLVLTPTRELAAQVARDFRDLAKFTDHKIMMAYGGTRLRQQAIELKRHPAIVVGTPGRVMDLMRRRMLHLDKLRFAVLDEVDRMLDIGFREDIRHILSQITCKHQTIFVSATIEEQINRLARQYMKNPLEVFCSADKLTVDEVELAYVSVNPWDKRRLLLHLLRRENPELAIVFVRTKRETTKVAKYLKDKGVNAKEIHGDLYQRKRDRVMREFRKGSIQVLVATDLASRGLDVDDITHIINYDVPEDPESYVHRVGRTARMGESGQAITLVTPDQGSELTQIEKLINKEVHQVAVEGFKPSSPPAAIAAEPAPAPAESVLSRSETPLFADKGPKAAPVRRTLGSKFPPRRKRRL